MKIFRWSHTVARGEVFHCARFDCTRRRPIPLHGHDFSEVWWIKTGRATYSMNGAATVIEGSVLAFVLPGDCHSLISATDTPITLTNVAFPESTVAFLRSRYPAGVDSAFDLGEPRVLRIEASRIDLLDQWADSLSRHSRRDQLAVDLFALRFMEMLQPIPGETLPREMPGWLAEACRSMRDPARFSEGVAGLARSAGRSPEHVSRVLREHLGISPTTYLNRLRMAHAALELEMTNREIVDIAYECGFEAIGHFYTLFRRTHGLSPHAFRRARRIVM